MSLCESLGISGVSFYSSSYPSLLREIPDPPAILFYSGSLHLAYTGRTVAVIGSRRCSHYGRAAARRVARALCSAGVTVVSGLARGIDGEAHRASLDAGGSTVAVFAGGLDIIYPPEHRKLADAVRENGCLVSEYPPGIRPAKYTFPERNRIISGLSSALVVIEAGEKSGTMITVGTALDQGRDVYAVPGEMGRTTSAGTNRLIRDGAGIVLSPEDMLNELGLSPLREMKTVSDPILKYIEGRGKTVMQLAELTGIPSGEIQHRLFMLEVAGSVIRHPGNIFVSV